MSVVVAASDSRIPDHRSVDSMIQTALNFVQGSGPETQNIALEGMNDGIAQINSITWNKIYKIWTITLAADDDDYELPADYKEPLRLLRLKSGNRDGRIEFKSAETFLREHPTSITSGFPNKYTIDYTRRLLILDLPPSANYISTWATLQHWHRYRIPNFVRGAGIIDLDPEFEWFLIWNARLELAMVRDPTKTGLAERKVRQHWNNLRNNDFDTEPDWGV